MKRLLFIVLCATTAYPQAADHANTRYHTEEGRAQIAQALGGPDREGTQKPKELVAALNIAPGSTVADIGTGVGFMLPYLREATGPTGRLIAEDIFPDFLDKAKASVKEKPLGDVVFILGTEKDPKLPADSTDLALILDAYHHFDYPAEMLGGIAKALKPGGRLAVVEYYKEGFGDPQHIRFTDKELVAEISSHGFELISIAPFLEKVQYLSIFRKK